MEEKEIDGYDVSVIYEIILAIKNILAKEEYRDLPLRAIYISVPGKVNSLTGELQLSKHFDSKLFEEKNKISQLGILGTFSSVDDEELEKLKNIISPKQENNTKRKSLLLKIQDMYEK